MDFASHPHAWLSEGSQTASSMLLKLLTGLSIRVVLFAQRPELKASCLTVPRGVLRFKTASGPVRSMLGCPWGLERESAKLRDIDGFRIVHFTAAVT